MAAAMILAATLLGAFAAAPAAELERALEDARAAYASSTFDRCSETLIAAVDAFDGEDPALEKRANQWIGLCEAAANRPASARRAFALARALPGSDPDPEVFPPAILELYRETKPAELPAPPPPAAIIEPQPPLETKEEEEEEESDRWWLWALLGAAAAAAVIIPIAAITRDDEEPRYTLGF